MPDIPPRNIAETYLAHASELNPGAWVAHSRTAARGAQLIAAHHPTLDPERAYILALLHDIGRRYGVHKERHALDGFRFLSEEGYGGAARVCLTHSFLGPRPVNSRLWDGSAEEAEFVIAHLCAIVPDDYDLLVQLCDAISLPQGFCLLEKRLVDVTMRYGLDEYTLPEWRYYFDVKLHIENAIGVSVYRLLPGIVETTFGWQLSAHD